MSAALALPTRDLIEALEARGFDVDGVFDEIHGPSAADPVEVERLAELIALGRTDEALAALRDLLPHAAPLPATIKTLVAARAAEPATRLKP